MLFFASAVDYAQTCAGAGERDEDKLIGSALAEDLPPAEIDGSAVLGGMFIPEKCRRCWLSALAWSGDGIG